MADIDYSVLYKDVNQITIRLANMDFSEVMAVHRMFVRMDDLDVSSGTGLLEGAEKVKRLYVFADVVELPSKQVRLPGSDAIIILCRIFVQNGRHNTELFLPSMNMSMVAAGNGSIRGANLSTTFKSSSSNVLEFKLQSGSMTSAVRLKDVDVAAALACDVQAASASMPLTVMTTGTSPGNMWVLGMTTAAVIPLSAVAVITDANILLGMQVTVLVAELVKTAYNSDAVVAAITRHVEWLNHLLVQAHAAASNEDVVTLLYRTQAFLKLQREGLVIPRLQYHMYKSLIDRMVQVAQNYDQDFNRLKLYVEQNKILGSYLLEQNKAFAEKEKEMDAFHSQIIALRTTELNNTIEKMDQLSKQMDKENKAMEQAKADMDAGLIAYQNEQVANAVFAVLSAIASVGLAFATGGATAPGAVSAAGAAVTAAGKAAEGLKKVIEILEGLQVVMEVVAAIKELVNSLQQIGKLVDAPEMPDLPSNADWDIFVNGVEVVAEQMPKEVAQVPAWKAKCKNVAALGREMSTTAAHIAELQYQLQVQEMLREIAQKQADRLSSIKPAELTNYLEMVSQMDMRTTRMLLELIRVLYIQNAALQYEYLHAPAPLKAWPVAMSTVWALLIQQETTAITGLLELGPSSDFTEEYAVKDIPVRLLQEGQDWEFEIPVLSADFPSTWSRVRIHHVTMQFDGGAAATHVPTTDSGEVYMLLQSSRFFDDRAKRENEFISYQAGTGLFYQYAYRLADGEATVSNIPTDEYANTFMRLTPFTLWRLRLSSSADENKGLAFPTATSADATTQIRITFHVSAIRRISTR